MRFIRRLAALLLAAALPLTLAACGGGEESGPRDDQGATLVYGSNDYTRINPAIDEHGEINILLFNGLTAHDGDNQVVPCLAESWTFDEAACAYTFTLRQDVRWHDGEPFTAADVKFTIEAIMDPANESEIASNYEDVTAITTDGDYSVTFTLAAPNVAFLDYMTIAVLPRHLLEGEDMQTSDYFRFPIGTGPYRMESWDEGQAITLVKNEDYFLGAAQIDRIVFKIVPDDNAKALQLRSGDLDLAHLTPRDAQTFAEDGAFACYRMETADYRGILYNFQIPYWQENGDLIPAFSCAVDRQAILDTVLLGHGTVAYGPLQRSVYNNPDVERWDYDPARAEALLAGAGCEKGEDGFYYRNGEKIGFTISVGAGDQVRSDMAQIAAQQLRAVGVDVDVDIPAQVDWASQDAYLIGWGSPFDADDHTYKVFGTGKGGNYSGYSDPLVDKYLTAARQTDDPEERARYYGLFQEALADHPAFTFLCYIDADYVADAGIRGIREDTVLGHHGVGIFWNVTEWTIDAP